MPGAGTKTDITIGDAPARCLDLTRLISRQGRGPLTGVDRVDLAYLRRLIAEPTPLYCLVRTSLGYVLLDRSGAEQLLPRIAGDKPWGSVDLLGRFRFRSPIKRRQAEADLRRVSIARCRVGGLAGLLASNLPRGTTYLNVGHSNLTEESLGTWRLAIGGKVSVMIHDTIPLDYPQFQRPGTPDAFRKKLKLVANHADLVIYNSQTTRSDAMRWFETWGPSPDGIVAHLGVDIPLANPADLPGGLDPNLPYFVILGTIEPRKNHALLLDVWDEMAERKSPGDLPVLVIAGTRGWANEAVFQRLDRSGDRILEFAGLGDAAIAALIAGSSGFLFPSLAEGYGLPPLEAAALGVPVVCNDLLVYREVLGNNAVYADSGNVYLWRQIITELAEKRQAERARNGAKTPPTGIPTWADHFNLVLKVT